MARLISKSNGREDVRLNDFLITHVLGQGAFGKVFLGELVGSSEQFAIKTLRKDKLAEKPD